MPQMIKKLRTGATGADGGIPIEYGLFAAVVSIMAIVAMEALGTSFSVIYHMLFG